MTASRCLVCGKVVGDGEYFCSDKCVQEFKERIVEMLKSLNDAADLFEVFDMVQNLLQKEAMITETE